MAPPKHRAKQDARRPADGTLRQSQLVTTSGPGALIDLVNHAVVMTGTDFWKYAGRDEPIVEPRLRAALAQQLQRQGRKLSAEHPFRAAPVGDDREPTPGRGIEVLEFPSWMVCQNPDCCALQRSGNLERDASRRCFHRCDDGRKHPCVPVRFVAACKRGHLEEFPWVYFAHRGQGDQHSCPSPRLQLKEGPMGDFSQIFVRCVACGERERLSAALAPHGGLQCHGRRPWLGRDDADEPCELKSPRDFRMLVRTASNGYFSQVVSALSIPEKDKEVDDAVETLWGHLETVESLAELGFAKKRREVSQGLNGLADASVLAAIEARRKGQATVQRPPLRTAEFEQLCSSAPEAPGELPEAGEHFFARTLRTRVGPSRGIAQVVLVHALREVRAQVGFTRLEAPTADLQGEFDLDVKSAPLGLRTDWLPASEVLGEGLFLRLDEAAVRAWEERPAVQARASALRKGYDAWAASLGKTVGKQHEQEPGKGAVPEFPGARFYLLHSLSHLLMSAISLECGYTASAMHERIYCASGGDAQPMAGLLLSTGTSGSEGTLGGLVEQGRHLEQHLRRAVDLGVLCSNDPVCASHSPQSDPTERFREGAACHGCLFVAECSCERFNQYLDRALVVPTLGNDASMAFFGTRP